jgi:regulator of sigma E protease
MSGITKDDLDRDFLGKLGLRPFRPRVPADLGRVLPGSAAERAGPPAGRSRDRHRRQAHPGMVRVHHRGLPPARGARSRSRSSARGGRFEVRATPEAVGEGAAALGRLGVEAGEALKREYDRMTTTVRYGPVEALWRAAHKVYDLSIFSVKMLADDRGRRLVEEPLGPDHDRRLCGAVRAARLDHLPRLPRPRERIPGRAQPAADPAARWGVTWCIISPRS